VTAEEKSLGNLRSIAVTNDYWLTQAEKERMIADVENYRLDDLEQRKRAASRNDLELYCYNTKSSLKGVLDQSLNGALLDMIEQTIQWLENIPLASVEDMELKRKNIEHMLNKPKIPSFDHKLEDPLVEKVLPTENTIQTTVPRKIT